MSSPILPAELKIVHQVLPGGEPWPIISAENANQLPPLDPTQRQLITWLTLPLAAEAFDRLVVDPLQAALVTETGRAADVTNLPLAVMEDRFDHFRKKMNAGRAAIRTVHAAFTPEEPTRIQWLIPSGTSTTRYLTSTMSANISAPTINGFRRVSMPSKLLQGASRKLLETDQPIPREDMETKTADKRQVSLRDPLGRAAARRSRDASNSVY